MRCTFVAVFAALSALALSQSLLSQLPKCAQDCFGSNYGSCAPLNIGCICGNSTLINGLSCCVATNCSAADRDTTIKFASNLCLTYQVTVPTVASCASTAAPTASGSTNSPATASGSLTSTISGASVLSGSAGASSTPAATHAGSTGAAALHTAGAMGLAMAGLFAFM